jgi:hypothetical protein
MPSLTELTFRSSADVELKQLSDLMPEQRAVFAELEAIPDFYGLLVPRLSSKMTMKSVERQTAELFRTLATASHLDDALLGDAASDVVDLVLDGILEIDSGDGFVSGADAFPFLCPAPPVQELADAAARLSREALLYAEDLETNDARALTHALYLYNRIPMTSFWRTRFADRDAILSHVGAAQGSLRALLEQNWIVSYERRGWVSWSAVAFVPKAPEQVTYKLYVSPRPERIRDVFEAVVRVLSLFPGIPFKIGDSAAGMLRPDKLVAYFATREELAEVAEILRGELAGCDAQGVPFTAGLDDTGLLSWGVDPPDSDRVLSWMGRHSWRTWVVQRIGAALEIAKNARGAAIEPWRFAIERARRHGVDVESWTPSPALWSTP